MSDDTIVLVGRIRYDNTEHVDAGGYFAIPAGGTFKREDDAAFNVRTLRITPEEGAVTGLVSAAGWRLPADALIFPDADVMTPIVGKRVEIVIRLIDEEEGA